jgi:long-chain acyl-CoA synthetase
VRTHLASLVEDFRRHAAATAVVAHRGNRRYATTYGELAELAARTAAELERRGIAAGDRVVLWGENSAEWIGTFFGCLLRGVIAVPLDVTGSTGFVNRVVTDVSPRLIVGDHSLLASLECDIPRLFFSEVNAKLPTNPMFTVSDVVNSEAPFQIIFTSGTTAEPKGIVLTHRNVLASLLKTRLLNT